jgi:hypothetical protein
LRGDRDRQVNLRTAVVLREYEVAKIALSPNEAEGYSFEEREGYSFEEA